MTRLTILFALALGVLAVAFQPSAADASIGWDFDDPVVSIGGQTVSIYIGVQGEEKDVRKSLDVAYVRVHIPENVPASVVLTTKRYFREDVAFVRDGGSWRSGQPIRVQLEVTFKASKEMPAQLRTVYLGGEVTEFGTTSGRLVERFTLK